MVRQAPPQPRLAARIAWTDLSDQRSKVITIEPGQIPELSLRDPFGNLTDQALALVRSQRYLAQCRFDRHDEFHVVEAVSLRFGMPRHYQPLLP